MISPRVTAVIFEAVSSARASGQLPLQDGDPDIWQIVLERPRQRNRGDLSCSLPMQLASRAGDAGAALQLAQILVSAILAGQGGRYFKQVVAVPPGFINFDINFDLCAEILQEIALSGPEYGRSGCGLVETRINDASLPSGLCDTSDADANKSADSFMQSVFLQHAWCNSILRLAREERFNINSGRLEAPLFTGQQWHDFLDQCRKDKEIYLALETPLPEESQISVLRRQNQLDLILRLSALPQQAALAAHCRHSGHLIQYCRFLIDELVSWRRLNLSQGLFYSDLSVLKARLGLIFALRQVLSNVLGIIDLPALEHM